MGSAQQFVLYVESGPGRGSGSGSGQRERQRELPSLSSFVISLLTFVLLPFRPEHSNHLVHLTLRSEIPAPLHTNPQTVPAGCLEPRIGLVCRLRLGRPEWAHLQEFHFYLDARTGLGPWANYTGKANVRSSIGLLT